MAAEESEGSEFSSEKQRQSDKERQIVTRDKSGFEGGEQSDMVQIWV